jgi:hypothetical protein
MAWPKFVLAMLIVAGAATWNAAARAQTGAPVPQPAPAAAQASSQAADNPVGSVATLQGSASVTHSNATHALALKDPIYKGDTLQTGVDGTLGITFDDETTFTLKPNARIDVDDFVYQDGGSNNAATFNVLSGTVAFVAAEVAHTGNMKIDTPTSSLGIRGTTGIVEIPAGGAAGGAVSVKLYPDADGRVGRIEVFGRNGASLGVLTRGATGFAVRPGAAGRFAAVPLQISPQEAERDRSFVRQTFATRNIGRQINIQRRNNPQQQRNQQRPNNLQRPGQQLPGREQRPELRTVPGGQPLPAGRPTLQQQPGQRQQPGALPQRQPGAQPTLQRPLGSPRGPGGGGQRKPPPPPKKGKGH